MTINRRGFFKNLVKTVAVASVIPSVLVATKYQWPDPAVVVLRRIDVLKKQQELYNIIVFKARRVGMSWYYREKLFNDFCKPVTYE